MKSAYQRWACGLLAAVLVLLAGCAAVVYAVDPCLYYRMPEKWDPVFFNERYQAAGIAKNVEADTVLLGSSMAANYRAGDIAEAFGTTAVRITIPDGRFREFDRVMDVLFRKEAPPERVVLALDANILMRDDTGGGGAMPEYLYDRDPFNDAGYLLNKDTLYYSAYVLMTNTWGGGETLDEGFTWDEGIWWNHMAALEQYQRPETEPAVPTDSLLPFTEENLTVVEGWITAHPETEFTIFFPPYSILYWDKSIRTGKLDAVFAGLSCACTRLLAHENVTLYGFLFDREIVENLDNYCDYVHHSGDVCRTLLQKMTTGDGQLTRENWQSVLSDWRGFVEDYDFERFWDTAYWQQQLQAVP